MSKKQHGERESGGAHRASLMPRLARAVARLFTAPFTGDPELAKLPADLRERGRRAALLRLIIACLMTVQITVAIPLAILNDSPPAAIGAQLAIVAFGALCLALNAAGRTDLAGALYIYLPMAAIVGTILQNPGGLDYRALLFYSASPVFILVAGLLLPRPFIWMTLALALGTEFWGVFTLPLAPAFSLLATGEPVRILAAAFLAISYILTAILTWVFARSARASIDTVGQAFERERELTALKDQFIIDANHELRTPIMALYNNLELLNAVGERGEPERRARLVQRALASGDTVLRLLRNVLDTAALESRAPRIEPKAAPLATAVRAVLETFDPREIGEPALDSGKYQAREVMLDIPADLIVWADEARLRQVLINLISNALKYSEPGTPISITASTVNELYPGHSREQRGLRHRGDATMARLSMRDQGLGVPRGDVPKLFNRFVRLERDIAGPVRGTGVGLYLCRVLVEAMGGRIGVESSGVPGEGSVFSFTLPLASAEALSQLANAAGEMATPAGVMRPDAERD
jgi:signal transduction histidine kinase